MIGVSLAGLITWLWQGSALALLAVLMVRGIAAIRGDAAASTRYLIWWTVLAAIVVLPLAGQVSVWSTAPAATRSPLLRVSEGSATGVAADRAMDHTLPVLTLPPVPGWLVATGLGGWLAFAGLRLCRVARAFHHLTRLRRRCRPLAPGRQRRLERWTAQQARGRRTRLAVSDDITVPALFGLTRPMVIIPRRLLDILTDDELDHVVMHEHAHAQRWDDWALLLQSCVSAIVGLHPAVWATTRALGRERELACDDRVIAQGGSPRTYALSVTKVAEVTLGALPPALAPGMSTARGALTHRIERLLGQTSATVRGRPSIFTLAATAGILVALIALLGQLPPLASTERPSLPRVARQLSPPPARPARIATTATQPTQAVSRLVAGATPPAQPAVDRPEAGTSEPGPPEPALTAQTLRLAPIRSISLTPRAETIVPVQLSPATDGGAGWAPPRPLSSRPIAASSMTAAVNRPVVAPKPGLWRQLADGGKAIGSRTADGGKAMGSRTAEAGQSTGNAFKRFGLSIGRAFTGEP